MEDGTNLRLGFFSVSSFPDCWPDLLPISRARRVFVFHPEIPAPDKDWGRSDGCLSPMDQAASSSSGKVTPKCREGVFLLPTLLSFETPFVSGWN